MQVTDVLKVIPLADISISDTNPRTYFDQAALQELGKSVAQYGVMTPVLLRPLEKGYQLVCGERRYRASVLAGKETIPANIRELSDEEAFELQIIENLERKEVHPLDEAIAFQRMLDSGRYSVDDIAAKLAKEKTFIVHRLKLNDLIEEVKTDFFNGELNLSQAVLIARLQQDAQTEIFQGYKGKKAIGYGSTKQLDKEITSVSLPLENALFSTEKVYAALPVCVTCPKRTGANPVMFPDMQEVDSCMDKTCYRLKTEAWINEKTELLVASGNKHFGKDHMVKPSAEVKALLDSYQVNIMEEFTDFHTYNPGNSTPIEMFYVAGRRMGTTQTVYVRKAESKKEAAAGAAPVNNYTEIDRINDRAARALELDEQKVHLTLIESLKSEFEKKKPVPWELDEAFIDSMFIYMALNNSEMYYMSEDIRALGYNLKYDSLEEFMEFALPLSKEDRLQICAIMMFRKSKGSSTGKGIFGQIIHKLAHAHPQINVAALQAEQDEIAAARIEKTTAKLAELKAETKPKKKK